MTPRTALFLTAALALAACGKSEDAQYRAARDQATKTVQAQTGGGAAAADDLELRWTVRNRVKGEEIVCAYAASKTPPPPGQRPTVIPVIVRGGKTIRAEDVGIDAFLQMQEDLCGPDWVMPAP